MPFLVDADLSRSATEVFRRHGHEAVDVRDVGLGAAPDEKIADYAKQHGLCLVSGDFDFADIRNYPPEDYARLVVLRLPRNATAKTILRLMRVLLGESKVLERLAGRLAIVEFGRIRLRPR